MEEYRIERLIEANSSAAKDLTNLANQLTETPEITVEHLQKVITSVGNYVFVAKNSQNRIVGMTTLISVPKLQGLNKSVIEDVVVDEAARGNGLGKKLIEAALQKAKELGIKKITLTSRPSREAANKMYQKMGWKKYETNNFRYDF